VKVENWGGKMHAKAVVVDQQFVVAGSMNWTSAGERTNDENTIVIKSPRIADQFSAYFDKLWHSVDDRWLLDDPDPESKDSGTSWNDGIDNDFDHLIDKEDPGTSSSPPPLEPLPPYRIVEKKEGNDLIKASMRDGKKVYYLPNHPNYNDVDIGSSGKWFPSTWEAQEDGWKKAR
jgi:phosphatidylserine/phosphatidylglycerophosphate/cardiolipin synthase-like enzyme